MLSSYLYRTASKYVFIASSVIDKSLKNTIFHPNTLFRDFTNNIPPIFLSSYFRYVTDINEFTHISIPEVAFLGRSNVGKSSIINSLTGRKGIARVSKVPGRTQKINYFSIIPYHKYNPVGYLVDLPGYGYASESFVHTSNWQTTTQTYLLNSRDNGALRRLYLLVDSRRGISTLDRAVMTWLDDGKIPYTVVLTKCDKEQESKIIKDANEVCMRYHMLIYENSKNIDGYLGPVIHVTSAREHLGIRELMWSVETEFFE